MDTTSHTKSAAARRQIMKLIAERSNLTFFSQENRASFWEIVDFARSNAPHANYSPEEVQNLFQDASEASRSVALAIVYAVPEAELFPIALEATWNPKSPIEQFIALQAIEKLFPQLTKEQKGKVKDALDNQEFIIPANEGRYEVATRIRQMLSLALIMKGGGVKGLAYVGALKELEKYYEFNWFVGTSAGAIAAVLLAAGYTFGELEDELREKDFRDFLDENPLKCFLNIFQGGLYTAEALKKWIRTLLVKKLESDDIPVLMKDLKHRATVYACKRYRNALIFDGEGDGSDTEAAFAVRCSMSIPFFFTPQWDQGLRVFDGGARNNYPVDILLKDHPNQDFVGLYLGPIDDETRSITSDLLSIWTEALDVDNLRKHRERTIIIDPTPISTLDFSLDKEEKDFLLEAGKTAALRFLFKRGFLKNEREIEAAQEKVEQTRCDLIQKRNRRRNNVMLIIGCCLLLLSISGFYLFSSQSNKNEDNIPVTKTRPPDSYYPTPTPILTPVSIPLPPPSPVPGVPAGPTQSELSEEKWVNGDNAEYIDPHYPGENYIPTDDGKPQEINWGYETHRAWALKNTGDSTWSQGYVLAFYGGHPLGANIIEFVEAPVRPNDIAIPTITFTTPCSPGIYQSYWRMRNPQGEYFGPVIGVTLDVKEDCGVGCMGSPIMKNLKFNGVNYAVFSDQPSEFEAEIGMPVPLEWFTSDTPNLYILLLSPNGEVSRRTANNRNDRILFTPTMLGRYKITFITENEYCNRTRVVAEVNIDTVVKNGN